MASHTENQRVLKDGALVIYQRTDVAKSTWHCRVKFSSQPYIRKSLKTASERVAVSKAEKLYDDLRYRHERGLALRSPPLPQAIDEYLAHSPAVPQPGRKRDIQLNGENEIDSLLGHLQSSEIVAL